MSSYRVSSTRVNTITQRLSRKCSSETHNSSNESGTILDETGVVEQTE